MMNFRCCKNTTKGERCKRLVKIKFVSIDGRNDIFCWQHKQLYLQLKNHNKFELDIYLKKYSDLKSLFSYLQNHKKIFNKVIKCGTQKQFVNNSNSSNLKNINTVTESKYTFKWKLKINNFIITIQN